MHVRKAVLSLVATLALAGGATAAVAVPAGAQPVTQRGLVNLAITDVGVQIPISLAANVCDVNVAVLVDTLADAPADCAADAGSEANITLPDGGGGPINQEGLVNVALSDIAVQVPIGIAANVCDVNAGILVGTIADAPATCDSDAVSVSQIQ